MKVQKLRKGRLKFVDQRSRIALTTCDIESWVRKYEGELEVSYKGNSKQFCALIFSCQQ